jgi:hypothetical protein
MKKSRKSGSVRSLFYPPCYKYELRPTSGRRSRHTRLELAVRRAAKSPGQILFFMDGTWTPLGVGAKLA